MLLRLARFFSSMLSQFLKKLVALHCRNSMGVISNETIVANHPWVDDVQGELDRLAAEKEANLDLYGSFGQNVPPDDEPPDDKNE